MQDFESQTQDSNNGSTLIANRYRLTKSLGKGSFGEVYAADDTKFNPPKAVAIKLLYTKFLQEPQIQEDIKQEASILARFNHPNILPVIDFEVNNQKAYIVVGLAEGGTLSNRIRPNPMLPPVRMPLPEVAWFLSQIAEALTEAHQHGLIHRDIKPANILLDKRGRPLLADFGLAATLSGSATSILVETGSSGTPLYMAPEQWEGSAGKASDIYSLGVMVYQLITGYPPFQGNQTALYAQHLNAPVPTLSQRAPDLRYPPELDQLLAYAMAKDPRQRIRNAVELSQRFQAALQQKPTINQQALAQTPADDATQVLFQSENLPSQPNLNSGTGLNQPFAVPFNPPQSQFSTQNSGNIAGQSYLNNADTRNNPPAASQPNNQFSNPLNSSQPNFGQPAMSQSNYNQPVVNQTNQSQPGYAPTASQPGYLPPATVPARRKSNLPLVLGAIAALVIIVAVAAVVILGNNTSSQAGVVAQATASPVLDAVSKPAGATTPNTSFVGEPLVTLKPGAPSLTVDLNAIKDGTLTGTSIITDPGDGTVMVELRMKSLTPGLHTSHIHRGTCINQASVIHELNTVVIGANGEGSSTTRLKVEYLRFIAGNLYLNVHNQVGTPDYSGSCGQISG